jgi:hypothetical protein
MSYEQSPFGDGSAAGSGNVVTTVNNQYGSRDTGDTNGVSKTEGFINELTIDINGGNVGAGAYALLAPTLPAGAIIEDVYMEVTEVFVLGGTTPVIDVGTETSEATNGFTITEAQAEALGSYDLTSALSGTWAAPLAAATTVGVLLGGGGSNTVTAAGKAKLVIRYAKL